jgi:hypothetical protein
MPERELLHEQVIQQHGSWQRVRRWWRGIHPELGTITLGWSGWETVEDGEHVRPVHVFGVREVIALEIEVPRAA